MTATITLPTAEATRAWGEALAAVLRAGDLVVLTGDLGAGKTTLTQGIGAGLHVRGQVASPTFIIAREHPPLPSAAGGPPGPWLVHVDAYRLRSLDEVAALDLESEMEEAVTVVEWGGGWVEPLSDDRLELTLHRPHGAVDPTGDEPADAGERVLEVEAVGPRWAGVALPGVGVVQPVAG